MNAVGSCCAVLAAVLAGFPAGAGATRASGAPGDAIASVSLVGEGTEGARQSLNAWGSAMFGAPSPVGSAYLPQGGLIGRQDFVAGGLDYFVSGLGPTADEQAALAKRNQGLLAIPLQSDAVGFLQWVPDAGFQPTTTVGPEVGVDITPGESVYYLEDYLHTAFSAQWDHYLATFGQPPGLVSERWPVSQATGQIEVTGVKAAIKAAFPGSVLALPPWGQLEAEADAPGASWQFLEVPNAAGEWVSPTTATVQAALVAGSGAGLSALTSAEPGAYPLSWTDFLYAPTSGLSPEKMDALATMVRYAVTSGRVAALATGTIPLPDPMVPQALAAADDLVRDNCTGTDVALVSTTDPGVYAPTPHALDEVGPRLVCQRLSGPGSPAPSAPAPSASAPPALPAPTLASPVVPTSQPPLPSSPVGAFSASAPASTVAPGKEPRIITAGRPPPPIQALPAPTAEAAPVQPGAKLISGLPFSGSRRTDTPVTLLMGAGLFWACYRLAQRIRQRRGS